jgi:Protein of unknown function (DUF4235)
VAKLIYRPFGLLFSVLGGILAPVAFKQLWRLLSHADEPPKATEGEYGKRILVDRVGRQRCFEALPRLTGTVDFEGHGIGKLLIPLVVRRQVRVEMPRNLQKLKQRLESST